MDMFVNQFPFKVKSYNEICLDHKNNNNKPADRWKRTNFSKNYRTKFEYIFKILFGDQKRHLPLVPSLAGALNQIGSINGKIWWNIDFIKVIMRVC